MTNSSFEKFREFACVGLSAIAGVLIGVPLTSMWTGITSIVMLTFFGVMGAAVGVRQRKHTFFFYLSLISVLILSSLVLKSFVA